AYSSFFFFFFFQAEDGIRYLYVTGVQTCALPISAPRRRRGSTASRRRRSCTSTADAPSARQAGGAGARRSSFLTSTRDRRPLWRSGERRVGKGGRIGGRAQEERRGEAVASGRRWV